MTLTKTVDGIQYIWSASQNKMIPRNVYGLQAWNNKVSKFVWSEGDEVYYHVDTDEDYLYYDDAIDYFFLTESEAITAMMRRLY